MNIRSKSSFARPTIAAMALVGSMIWIAPSAQAQMFDWDWPLPQSQIERMIQASGYRLSGPVIRRGSVYLADVLGRKGDPERLVIDAHDGRLLQRFPGNPPIRRLAAIPDEGPSQSPLITLFNGLFGSEDDVAPSSPPADIFETPKSKPQIRRPKSEHTPVAQPITAPSDSKAISLTPPATTPSAATPTQSDAASAPAVAPPVVADTKAAPSSSPTGLVAPNAATPKAPAPKLNDVPVAPLE